MLRKLEGTTNRDLVQIQTILTNIRKLLVKINEITLKPELTKYDRELIDEIEKQINDIITDPVWQQTL